MKICPLLKKECYKERCMWWVETTARNNMSGKMERTDNCAIAHLPLLQIEQLGRSVGIQKATESFRNEMVERQDQYLKLAEATKHKRLGE